MKQTHALRALLLLSLVLVAGFFIYTRPINLGLDLKGGAHIVLQAEESADAELASDIMDRAVAVIERRVNSLGVSEPLVQPEGSKRIIVELPDVHDPEEAIRILGSTALLEFKDGVGNTVLTGASLKDVRLNPDSIKGYTIVIEFNPEAAQTFANLTAKYVNTNIELPIVFDGEVIMSPIVNSVITDGRAEIIGNFTAKQASEMVLLLKSGSLPVPLEIVEVRNVGPTLGQESIDKSLKAGIIGIILVLMYMLLYYRLPGLAADMALFIYGVLVAGVLSLFKATLTLPGIAGLVLSIGMAVDANVIIFERVKEELKGGKRLKAAIKAGWNRAFKTILDSNVTTLITAFALYQFGTGPVRGFAVTLSVGVLVSMFTAIIATRYILLFFIGSNSDGMVKHFGVNEVSAR